MYLGNFDFRNKLLIFIQNTGGIGQQNQLLRVQRSSHTACHHIGVDIVALPFRTDTHRCNYRQVAPLFQGLDQVGIHLDYIADIADIYLLNLAVLTRQFLQQLFGKQQCTILTAQANRLAAMLVQVADHLFVNLPHQHHLHHCHGLSVGHPHAAYKLGDNPVPLEGLVNLGAAAMHNNGIDPQRLEHDHIQGKGLLQTLIRHGVTTVLDHKGAPCKTSDIGQGLHQGIGFFNQMLHSKITPSLVGAVTARPDMQSCLLYRQEQHCVGKQFTERAATNHSLACYRLTDRTGLTV